MMLLIWFIMLTLCDGGTPQRKSPLARCQSCERKGMKDAQQKTITIMISWSIQVYLENSANIFKQNPCSLN